LVTVVFQCLQFNHHHPVHLLPIRMTC
jgi:hypothetical protein